MNAMNDTKETTDAPPALPTWLQLPQELHGASVKELAERYFHLSEMKEAAETRAGRHPSGRNDPAQVDPDPLVREALQIALRTLVQEMAAVSYELHQRPGGFKAMLTGEVEPDAASSQPTPRP